MPTKTPLDDDAYVAQLLAEDARKSSASYAAVGLSALLPKRSVCLSNFLHVQVSQCH